MAKKTSSNNFSDEKKKMQEAALAGMEKAVIQLEADTKLLTHVDTGALRRSWTHKVESSGTKISGAVGSNLEYAPYEDDYHGNLSTALNNNNSEYFSIIEDAIKSAVGG